MIEIRNCKSLGSGNAVCIGSGNVAAADHGSVAIAAAALSRDAHGRADGAAQ